MKNRERFTAFDTTMGKYSARKIPQWRLGNKDVQEYLDMANTLDWDEGGGLQANPA